MVRKLPHPMAMTSDRTQLNIFIRTMIKCGSVFAGLFIVIVLVNCNNVIDVDDILAEDFMPGTLLMLENPKSNFNDSIDAVVVNVGDGSLNLAMETMGFHRSMMNEYLCRNYVAEEIIQDMTLSRIKRRMGLNAPGIQTKPSKGETSVKSQLLHDEGSSNYKDWLSKSTTLEDIYRHYDNVNNRVDEDEDKEDGFNEDYDGHVAGFAYQKQQQQSSPAKVGHGGGGGSSYFSGGGGGYSYSQGGVGHGEGGGYPPAPYGGSGISAHGGGGGGYGAPPPQEHIIHEPPKYTIIHEESHSQKEHDLSDLFDIALTALAFLAFKMFLIHVIMCISMATNPPTTAMPMMMPMSMSPTSDGGGMTGPTSTGMTGGGMTGTGGGMTGTGGGMTSTGTGGGMAGTGTGGGMTGTGTGGAMTGTGTGGGMTGTGTGGGGETGAAGTGEGGGETGAAGTGEGGGETGAAGTGEGGGETGAAETGEGGDGGTTGTGEGGDGGTTGTDEEGEGGTTGRDSPGTGTALDTGTAEETAETVTARDSIKFQYKREVPSGQNQALNELARRVLTSIEAAFLANGDDGNCLRQTLCENNRYSRDLEGKSKIFIPVWSLGMSWLAGRLTKNVNPATSMLDSLKASVLGLGKAKCEVIYQHCNLRLQKRERLRRKRRSS